jgi:hypothetical protein
MNALLQILSNSSLTFEVAEFGFTKEHPITRIQPQIPTAPKLLRTGCTFI